MNRPLIVNAFWDDDAEVWVATCDDIHLATESETMESLIAKLNVMIPELVEANGGPDENLENISFQLRACRDEVAHRTT
jgi:hypothetical protein